MNRNQHIVYVLHLLFKGGLFLGHLLLRLVQRGWRLFGRWSAYGRRNNLMR